MNLTNSVISPKRPTGKTWWRVYERSFPAHFAPLGYPVEAWRERDSGLFCISSVKMENPFAPRQDGLVYSLTMSVDLRPFTVADLLFAVAAFDLQGAESNGVVAIGKSFQITRRVFDKPVVNEGKPDANAVRIKSSFFGIRCEEC
jgi:hypothetical protein